MVGSARESVLTSCGSTQGFVSPERRLDEAEVGCVVRREGVQVPSEGVLLIKGAVYHMARDGVNYFGRRPKLRRGLEPSKM